MTTAIPSPSHLSFRCIMHTDESVRRQRHVFELLPHVFKLYPTASVKDIVRTAVRLVDEVHKQAPLVEAPINLPSSITDPTDPNLP